MKRFRVVLGLWMMATLVVAASCTSDFDQFLGHSVCGNGAVEPGEACDDGNDVNDDGCSNDCERRRCGDAIVQKGEECDDGNFDTATCTSKCTKPRCGDGIVSKDEECDDGAHDDNGSCTKSCKLARCGDGLVQTAVEQCDEGPNNGKAGNDGIESCTTDCKLTRCGDGLVQPPEQCDDGDHNPHGDCPKDCRRAACGDGYVWLGHEQCDNGNGNDDHGACTSQCLLAHCGDGVVQPPEQCDDGNAIDSDDCTTACQKAVCGDGFVHAGTEECDDGNTSNFDDCLNDCRFASCGDGFVRAGVEQCDLGKNNCDGCACESECKNPTCGNCLTDPGEQCDDCNPDNTDGCLMTCLALDLCKDFAITDVQPPLACVTSQPATLTLTASGLGFLIVNGKQPTVTINGTLTAIQSMSNKGAACTPIFGGFNSLQSCSTMVVSLPPGLVVGSYTIEVINPTTLKCKNRTSTYVVAGPPTITSVTPAVFCAGQAPGFDVTGTGFAQGTQVTVTATVAPFTVTAATKVTFVSGTLVHADFPILASGLYDVTVANGKGCSATKANGLKVNEPPLVFFVSPDVLWDGAETPITIYTANVSTPVADVSIKLNGSNNVPTKLTFAPAPKHPERPVAQVPKATPSGSYDVTVTDFDGCVAPLAKAFDVTSDTSLKLLKVAPSFASPLVNTPVTVTASNVAPSTGFVGLPTMYLTGGGLITPVVFASVSVNSATSLTAVLPAGAQPGTFDLVVVNPNKTVGVLPKSFTVVDPTHLIVDLPVIDSIEPAIVSNADAAKSVVINGSGFINTPTPITVTLQCIDPTHKVLVDQVLAVTSYSATSLTVTVNGALAQYTDGANCVVLVKNPSGSQGEYSSLVIITPNQNLTNFFAGPSLNTGRRGLGGAPGRASDAARYVYALAGDDGAITLKTVEFLGVDIFGLPASTWTTQRYQLNTARTMVGATAIGRFIYVVGGTTSYGTNSVLNTVERAAVLDALLYPQDLGVDLALSKTDGLGAGLYYYRVAAIMGGTDPFNPGGETLPTSPFGVNLPDLSGKGYKLRVALSWTAVPGAVGYLVYRSVANGAPGSETLIVDTTKPLPATVTCPTAVSCTDLGATPGAGTYLPSGSTGVWTTLSPTLATARQGSGVTSAIDPGNTSKANLYVMGGFGPGGTALNTYEYLTLTLNADKSQTPDPAFVTGANKLTVARWKLGGYSATQKDSGLLNGTFVWAGSGASDAAGTTIAGTPCNFDYAKVQSGGALGVFTNTFPSGDTCPGAGYGAFSAPGDYLYALGGQNGIPSVSNVNAHLIAPPGAANNFQGFTPGLTVARVELGAAVQSGNFWALCGRTTGNVVTKSTEYVLY